MKLEITPEPTDAEREAIAAALAPEAEMPPPMLDESDAGDCEEIPRP
jgi:hypothetical protein